MRNNQPVTGHEYEFPSSHMLVSATDLTGRIQYCNPAFIAVSGFTRDELIGQPHNLIRHPDMPREAFADMWATIRDGPSVDRAREEPPQERRSLLGACQCHAGGRERRGRRLF